MFASKPALFALLCIMLLGGACGGGDDTATGDTDISKVADNFARVRSFKATISGGPGSPEGRVEYQEPNSIRITVGSGPQEQQIICIDSDFYAKQGGAAQWQKVPAGGGSNPSCRANLGPADPKVIADGIRAVIADPSLQKGSTERVNGKSCQLYTQILPNAGSRQLCIANGLPQRIVSKGAGPEAVTITFADYDKGVDIKAPI